MARDSLPSIKDLLQNPPWVWFLALSVGFPWLRLEGSGWLVYPGHIAGALVAGLLFAATPRSGASWGGIRPLALLFGYLAVILAARGEVGGAAILAGTALLHALWGLTAFELARRDSSASAPAQEALLMLISASIVTGLAAWLAVWLWPAGCVLFSCQPGLEFPQPFLGGWRTHGQFLIWLILTLPFLGGVLLAAFYSPHASRARQVLSLLAAAAGLGFLAGATLWSLLLACIAAGLLWLRLAPWRHAGERLLLKGAAFGVFFGVVLVFGLAPGYLGRLTSDFNTSGALRIEADGELPRVLSSDRAIPISLRLINTGWSELGTGGESALRFGARLQMTTGYGATRGLDLAPITLDRPIPPGEALSTRLPVRLPPWVREGYLSWWAENGQGRRLLMGRESLHGFRFTNGDYRRLELDTENRVTALAMRARDLASRTTPQEHRSPNPDNLAMVLGDMLDTLFFSPLWGEADTGHTWSAPFNARRPFWADLFHRFGLIGLGLALWAYLRLFRQTMRISAKIGFRHAPIWGLLPLSILLLGITGLFSGDLSSYHAVWAFFLLSGWVEGRFSIMFPRPVASISARHGPLIHIPLFGRLFGGRDARYRGRTGRTRRR